MRVSCLNRRISIHLPTSYGWMSELTELAHGRLYIIGYVCRRPWLAQAKHSTDRDCLGPPERNPITTKA